MYSEYSSKQTSNAHHNYGFLKSGVTIIPHPKKEFKGGEDAFAIRPHMISVADGVGGWAKRGIDVAKYSKQLMRLIAENYDSHPDWSPKEILTEAYKNTTEIGSTTVVLAILDPHEQKIATTLVGDSSYMILRNKSKLYRSKEQQHRFNCPYQVGTGKDHPYMGADEIHSVLHNDIIIMGTDGVWDNAFDEEIMEIVKENLSDNGNLEDPQNVSQTIAKLVFEHSNDKKFESPFQKNSAADKKVRTYFGGKKDDITVIVSQIRLE